MEYHDIINENTLLTLLDIEYQKGDQHLKRKEKQRHATEEQYLSHSELLHPVI